MELSFPLGITRSIPREKFPRKPYNRTFIDQACSVKIAQYWPRSFLRVYGLAIAFFVCLYPAS